MKKYYLWMMGCLFAAPLCAQKHTIPLAISIFNESTALPFTRLITLPIHPGMQIGTEWNYRARPHNKWVQTAHVSYFFHRYLFQGVALQSEIGHEYRFNWGISLRAMAGVGYLHTFGTAPIYVLENGQYVKKLDKGNARVMPSLSLGVGYDLQKQVPTSPRVFIAYQSWVEYPYSPGFIPLMTHINLHLGVRFFLPSITTKPPHVSI